MQILGGMLWGRQRGNQYFWKLALSALCPFYGQQESAFSVMSNITQTKSANLRVEIYESYQAVKYNLKSMQVSAIQYYTTKESPVNI